jgi:hypothetical protein
MVPVLEQMKPQFLCQEQVHIRVLSWELAHHFLNLCPPSVYCCSALQSSSRFNFNDTDDVLCSLIIYYSLNFQNKGHIQCRPIQLSSFYFPFFSLRLTFTFILGLCFCLDLEINPFFSPPSSLFALHCYGNQKKSYRNSGKWFLFLGWRMGKLLKVFKTCT